MKSRIDVTFIILFILISLASLNLRISYSVSAPKTTDDLLAIHQIDNCLIQSQNKYDDVVSRLPNLESFQSLNDGKNQIKWIIIKNLIEYDLFKPAFRFYLQYICAFVAVPSSTTYPVSIYPITSVLNNFFEWDVAHLGARVLNSILILIVCALILYKRPFKFSGYGNEIYALFLWANPSLIWYSSFSYPYALSTVIFPIIALILSLNLRRNALIIGFAFGCLLNISYLAIIFFPGLLYLIIKKQETLKGTLRAGIYFSIMSMLLSLPSMVFINPNQSTNWNAGFNNEYVIAQGHLLNVFSAAYDLTSMFSIFQVANYPIFIYCFIFIALFGAFKHKRNEGSDVNKLAIFAVVTYFTLCIFGKLNLSPTRHALILLPICCYFFVDGLITINNLFNAVSNKFKLLYFFNMPLISSIAILALSLPPPPPKSSIVEQFSEYHLSHPTVRYAIIGHALYPNIFRNRNSYLFVDDFCKFDGKYALLIPLDIYSSFASDELLQKYSASNHSDSLCLENYSISAITTLGSSQGELYGIYPIQSATEQIVVLNLKKRN